MVRDLYLTVDINLATVLVDRAIRACLADDVPEIQTLGRTLRKWRVEILNHHRTGASNGPTEGMNLRVKKVKRAGHRFRCFDHYRLRVLLHAGGCDWTQSPTQPDQSEPDSPHSNEKSRETEQACYEITHALDLVGTTSSPRTRSRLANLADTVTATLPRNNAAQQLLNRLDSDQRPPDNSR